MKKRILHTVILIATLFALGACTEVTSKSPVGEKLIPAKDFVGVWQGGAAIFYVTDKDAEHGILSVSTVKIDDKTKRPSLVNFDIQLRGSHETVFVSCHDNDHPDKDRFYFGKVVYPLNNPNKTERGITVIFSAPDKATFARLIASGDIRGTTEKNSDGSLSDVQVTGINDKEAIALSQPSNASAFSSESTFVFTRRPDLDLSGMW